MNFKTALQRLPFIGKNFADKEEPCRTIVTLKDVEKSFTREGSSVPATGSSSRRVTGGGSQKVAKLAKQSRVRSASSPNSINAADVLKASGLTAKEFAQVFELNPKTVERWTQKNGATVSQADMLAYLTLISKKKATVLEALAEANAMIRHDPQIMPIAAGLRVRNSMTVAQFSDTFHIPVTTLEAWERKGSELYEKGRGATIPFLKCIWRRPKQVISTLNKGS